MYEQMENVKSFIFLMSQMESAPDVVFFRSIGDVGNFPHRVVLTFVRQL